MYDNFRAHVHGEFVDKPTFKEIMLKSGVENERVADHWFNICDPDHDGKIIFKYCFMFRIRIVHLESDLPHLQRVPDCSHAYGKGWLEGASRVYVSSFTVCGWLKAVLMKMLVWSLVAFKCYDIDGNGSISKCELSPRPSASLIRRLMISLLKLFRDELYNMLLSTNKFIDRLTEHTLHKPRETAEQRAQFAAQKAMEVCGCPTVASRSAFLIMAQYADSNDDGQVSLDEFMTWVHESLIFESGVDIFLPASAAMAALIAETPPVGSPPRSRAGSIASPRPLP
jgi:Ca2+-binding EF-hand superfamily protein